MNDSWGDGWNGNTMDVLVDGTVVLDDVTLGPGLSTGTLSFAVTTGADVTTIWNGGGGFGFETSYRILDTGGTEVGSGSESDITTGTITANCPSCLPPNSLAASSITQSSASVSWSDGGTSTDFEWELVDVTGGGSPTGSGTLTAGATTASLSLLNSGNIYDFYVRAICGGDQSSWVSVSFTTLPDYCSGDSFFDSGGPLANYSSGEDIVTTISPDTPGDLVTVTFISFDTESGYDFLEIFDGDTTGAASLGVFSGTTLPGPFTSSHVT